MSNIYTKMGAMQEAYDNLDNPDYYDEYQAAEEMALEAETDFQEKLIVDDIGMWADKAVEALRDYLIFKTSGDGDDDTEFAFDMKDIISSTYHAPWCNRHQPLNRQIAKAIRFKAVKMAKEVLS